MPGLCEFLVTLEHTCQVPYSFQGDFCIRLDLPVLCPSRCHVLTHHAHLRIDGREFEDERLGVNLEQEITLLHVLVIVHMDPQYAPVDFRTDGDHIGAYVGVSVETTRPPMAYANTPAVMTSNGTTINKTKRTIRRNNQPIFKTSLCEAHLI